jgi:hypothetical protein
MEPSTRSMSWVARPSLISPLCAKAAREAQTVAPAAPGCGVSS